MFFFCCSSSSFSFLDLFYSAWSTFACFLTSCGTNFLEHWSFWKASLGDSRKFVFCQNLLMLTANFNQVRIVPQIRSEHNRWLKLKVLLIRVWEKYSCGHWIYRFSEMLINNIVWSYKNWRWGLASFPVRSNYSRAEALRVISSHNLQQCRHAR